MSEHDDETVEPQSDPIADAILNADAHAVEAEPQIASDAPVDSGADDAEEQAEAVEELILGKFKSADDLAEAYRQLEQKYTLTAQEKSDLQALLEDDGDDEPQRPWGAAFQNAEPQNEEELIGWAERDPGAAAQWVVANQQRVPQELVNTVWEHWVERKPAEAMAWYTQQQTAQMQQQYEQRIAELQNMVEPLRDQQTQSMFEGALEALESQIPDLPDYTGKIQEYIDNIPVDQLHLAFFPNGMDTPEKVQEGVKSLYAIVRMREMPAQQQAQAQQQMQQQAFTQSRQGIVDQGPTDYDAKINAAILNG